MLRRWQLKSWIGILFAKPYHVPVHLLLHPPSIQQFERSLAPDEWFYTVTFTCFQSIRLQPFTGRTRRIWSSVALATKLACCGLPSACIASFLHCTTTLDHTAMKLRALRFDFHWVYLLDNRQKVEHIKFEQAVVVITKPRPLLT